MSTLLSILLICCGVLGVVALIAIVFGITLYNSLIQLKVLVDEAWSGIDVQLKKRFDLIPNLVETVKGYAKHEQETFERVTQLRASMMGSQSPEELAKYEGEMRTALKSLFAVAEAYPELKANENFLSLQASLQSVEDNIESARRYYNGTVRNYNIKIGQFPNNLVANYLNFKAREFFEVENEQERQNVKVSF
jgi:LemA protein